MEVEYKKNFSAVMARWQNLWNGEMRDGILCQIQIVEGELPRDPFMRNVPDFQKMFEDYSYYHQTRRNLLDDSLPVVAPNFGAGIDGGFLGCPIEFESGTCWCHPISLDKLQPEVFIYNPENRWVKLSKEALSSYVARAMSDVVVAPPIQTSPFDLVSFIRGSEILTDMYDCPDVLEAALDRATSFVIECREDHLSRISDHDQGCFWGWMHWWFPGKGLSIGDDQLGNCGPQAYARFGLPYHQRLLDHFGGGWYHLHSKDLCLVPEIAQLKGLDCLEISDDPNTPKRGFSSIDDIRQHLPETPLRICCGPDELLNGLRDGTLPGNVVYYVSGKDYSDIDCWSIDDANEIMDMVRAYKTGRRES